MSDSCVLFILSSHSPSVGGMRQLSNHLIQCARQQTGVQVQVIVWQRCQCWLLLFGLQALVSGVWASWRSVDVVHIGDPILALVEVILSCHAVSCSTG